MENYEMVRDERISAGSYDLNKFLFGGYENDIITTIYGPGGSGKSNLCMMLCVSQARKGNKVIYVDTEGGFSLERFKQIHGGTKEEVEAAMQHILLLKPTSFSEQEKDFEKLLLHVKKGDVTAIIIDSMVMLYRLELGDAITARDDERIYKTNRRLAYQLKILNEIARKQHLPVLITNQVYAFFSNDEQARQKEREVSMVGGDLLKYWSKCLLELQNSRGRRRIILRKHRSLPEKEMYFEILQDGIKKRGLF